MDRYQSVFTRQHVLVNNRSRPPFHSMIPLPYQYSSRVTRGIWTSLEKWSKYTLVLSTYSWLFLNARAPTSHEGSVITYWPSSWEQTRTKTSTESGLSISHTSALLYPHSKHTHTTRPPFPSLVTNTHSSHLHVVGQIKLDRANSLQYDSLRRKANQVISIARKYEYRYWTATMRFRIQVYGRIRPHSIVLAWPATVRSKAHWWFRSWWFHQPCDLRLPHNRPSRHSTFSTRTGNWFWFPRYV